MINCCIIFNPVGGSEGHSQQYATNLCTGLAEIDTQVYLVTSRDFDAIDVIAHGVEVTYSTIDDSKKRTVQFNSLISKLRYGAFIVGNNFRSFSVLSKVLKGKQDCACVLVGGDTLTNILYLLANNWRYRTVFALTIHNADYEHALYANDIVKLIYKLISKFLLKILFKTRVVIFVHGEAMQKTLAEQMGVTSDRISIYKVPTKEVRLCETKAEVNRDHVRLLFCGVIRHDKGFDLLCEALSKCAERDTWRLRVAGSARQVGDNYIYDLTKKSGIESNCSYNLKYLSSDEIDNEFQNTDIVVLPYRRGFVAQSVVMTDAIRWSKPVIVSEHSQNGYDAIKFHLGWVFQSENMDSLVDSLNNAIAECLKQPAAWGFKEFMEAHKPASVAKSIIEATSKILQGTLS